MAEKLTPEHICNCGTCRIAYERGAQLVKKMLADDECPVFAFAVAEGMAMASAYLMSEMAAARHGGRSILAQIEGFGAQTNIQDKMAAYSHDHMKVWNNICEETTMAYNDFVDRHVADKKAMKADAPDITKKGG